MSNDANARIRRIIIDCLRLQIEPDELAEGEPLFGDEDFDSIGSLEIVEAIEREFEIGVNDEELTENLLTSVRSLTEFVEQRLAEKERAASSPVTLCSRSS